MKAYKTFDMHTHAFPKKISKRAVEKIIAAAEIPSYHNGSFNSLYEYEKRGGADAFMLMPIATKASSTRSINNWVAGKVGGGVHAFGTIHPESTDVAGELDHVLELGLKGIKLHAEYQEFYINEPRMLPIYEAIFSRGLIICFHAGVDLGYAPPIRGSAKYIAEIADMFPQARMIAAHMGGYLQQDEVFEYLVGKKNVWMDTCYAAERMAPEDIVRMVRLHGADKFFFGTDAPWAEFRSARDAIINSGLNEDEIADILWNNAASFLGVE